MIKATDLRDYVIVPVLKLLEFYDPRMYSPAAVNLLLGTAAHESLCGFHLKQVKGPALGIYQIEPATHADLFTNFLRHRPGLLEIFQGLRNGGPDQLVWDLRYSTAVARTIYWRAPDALPDKDDIDGQAMLWKKVFNTSAGRGSTAAYLENANNVLDAFL